MEKSDKLRISNDRKFDYLSIDCSSRIFILISISNKRKRYLHQIYCVFSYPNNHLFKLSYNYSSKIDASYNIVIKVPN